MTGDRYEVRLVIFTKPYPSDWDRDLITKKREDPAGDGYAPLRLLKEYDDDREIAVGAVDVHVNQVETQEQIRDKLLTSAEILGGPSRISANPDCGLRTRTWDVAFAKLRNMVAGARMARKSYT